jgi:hypothetical protein
MSMFNKIGFIILPFKNLMFDLVFENVVINEYSTI